MLKETKRKIENLIARIKTYYHKYTILCVITFILWFVVLILSEIPYLNLLVTKHVVFAAAFFLINIHLQKKLIFIIFLLLITIAFVFSLAGASDLEPFGTMVFLQLVASVAKEYLGNNNE
jgi:hypothetical protein